MALSANAPLTQAIGESSVFPVAAAVHPYEGSMLGDASGYARPLVAGDKFLGHSQEEQNNTGAAGVLDVEALTGRYTGQVTIASVAITDIDKDVFASDDGTYTLTRGANTLVGKVKRYVTTNTAVVEFDTTRSAEKSTLLGANIALGAELADDAGVFVDFVNPITIDGTTLRAGDVLRVKGLVKVPDANGTDTLDVKLLLGTETIFQTGDLTMTDDAGNDVIEFEVDITINAIGASGKVAAFGTYTTLLNTTYATKTIDKAEATEDISGSVVIKVQGDWSAAHDDNEAYLKHLNVEHLKVQR